MNTEEPLLLAWLERAHLSLGAEAPPPRTLSTACIFAACELLGHYIVQHLKATEVGLCVFEAVARRGDSPKAMFRRQNEAQKRRGILLKVIAHIEGVLLEKEKASERWSKVLIAEPQYGISYQSRLLSLWDETTIAEKFLLLGGERAAREECGKLTRKEIAALASVLCGRGTLRSGQQDPDSIDARLVVSVDQLKSAREKVAPLQAHHLWRYSFPLIDRTAAIPVFFGGLQRRVTWIGKT